MASKKKLHEPLVAAPEIFQTATVPSAGTQRESDQEVNLWDWKPLKFVFVMKAQGGPCKNIPLSHSSIGKRKQGRRI